MEMPKRTFWPTQYNTHFYTLCCGLNCVPNKQKLNSNFRYLSMWSDVNTGSLLLLFSPQLYLILCNPMDYSTPGFPVLQHLPEFAQTHVHWLNEAMQPSPPQSPPSPPALNLSQHQGLLQWLGSPQQVLEYLLPKYWSFSFSISPFSEYSGLISFSIDWFDLLLSKGLSRVFTSTTVWRHQFFGALPFLLSSSHICIWLLEKP